MGAMATRRDNDIPAARSGKLCFLYFFERNLHL